MSKTPYINSRQHSTYMLMLWTHTTEETGDGDQRFSEHAKNKSDHKCVCVCVFYHDTLLSSPPVYPQFFHFLPLYYFQDPCTAVTLLSPYPRTEYSLESIHQFLHYFCLSLYIIHHCLMFHSFYIVYTVAYIGV